MRIVAGLGNPGSRYAGTRHNVGFAVVDELARRWRMPLGRGRDGVRVAHGVGGGEATTLVQPQMYMNLSGAALSRVQPPVEAKDLVVIHDDLDLEPGCVRLKRGGGTAGHRGLDSIVVEYGSDFTRVRVGIGRPPRGADVEEYVLSAFDPSEREIMAAAVQRAADAVECVLRAGEEAAMNNFNMRANSRPALAASMGRN